MPHTKTKKSRTRTYSRNRTVAVAITKPIVEGDGVYLLKLILVVLLGTFWIKLRTMLWWNGIPFGGFPLGAVVGLAGIHLIEKNQFDRKIWYAVLIVVTIICNFIPAGVML